MTKYAFTIDNCTNDILDSRDIQKRIDDLESEKESFIENKIEELIEEENENKDNEDEDEFRKQASDEFDQSDEGQELIQLTDFKDSVNSSEWNYGLILINESYFTDYCKEMLADCGELPKELPDYIVIDWELTADNLKVDYSTESLNGETFYYRD